jgi:hypothetical protein
MGSGELNRNPDFPSRKNCVRAVQGPILSLSYTLEELPLTDASAAVTPYGEIV